MNKTSMSVVLVFLAGVAACGSRGGGGMITVAAPPVPGADDPRIGLQVSGTATMEIVPDTVDLRMTLTAEAPRPAAAAKAVNERQAAVQKQIAALTLSGVKIDLALSFLSVQPLYDAKTGRVRGYQAAITLTLSTGDFDRVADLMELGAQQSATEMSTSFRSRDLTGAKKKVRDQALAAVKAKAEQMAGGLGVKLGKIVNIAESAGQPWDYGYVYGPGVPNAQSFQPASDSAGLRPDAQQLTLTITVGYELAAG
jgi:uncharacterized protein YggE